jgi:hypothetical protein
MEDIIVRRFLFDSSVDISEGGRSGGIGLKVEVGGDICCLHQEEKEGK